MDKSEPPPNISSDANPLQASESPIPADHHIATANVGVDDGGIATGGGGGVLTGSFSRFTSGFGLRLAALTTSSTSNGSAESKASSIETVQGGVFNSLTKGIADSSKYAVKALQVKARHMVSQNKRRYQEGDFDLDLTYITENVIAMGFPAGDMSSGVFFGYVEGFYRNHMEEVIKFLETQHEGQYKVYNLCSERLYDGNLFGGKVACFPFDDHNCPPIQMISSFCHSAYSWLKADIMNVVVVHCKAGMARTGLMICSLLIFLKFFPTAEEVIDYYNQKRCVDGKGLVLPSQIRYVKYFESILKDFSGETPPGRRCMLRGFRLHHCPYWIRPSITISNHNGELFTTKKHPKTKDLLPEDFWISAPKKGIVVFALPGEPGLTELVGDFKIHFQDHQGDFYCWLNTTMTENRQFLNASDLDGFDKRKLPSPGFQIEVVMIDYDGTAPTRSKSSSTNKLPDGASDKEVEYTSNQSRKEEKDDVFSDSEGDQTPSSKRKPGKTNSSSDHPASGPEFGVKGKEVGTLTHQTGQLSMTSNEHKRTSSSGNPASNNAGTSDFKAISADASVFSFGDDEDYDSE